jgi:hypothetical protein
VATDGSRLGSEETRGRVTVLIFVTTYDMGSQIVVREVADLFRRHVPRFNAGVVVLEPPRNAPLAEAFAAALELPFPLAMADPATLEGRGPFGEVIGVPTMVVLDATGAERHRSEGVVSTAAIERVIVESR